MATTQNTYTGDGSTVLFSFTFPYISEQDVFVSLDGTELDSTTEYSFANATTIQFATAPVQDAAIRIFRQTSNDDVKAVFFPGSAIRARDLNDNFTQVLYSSQESDATAVDAVASASQASTAAANAASDAATATAAVTVAESAATQAQTDASTALAQVSTAQQAATDSQAAAAQAISEASTATTAAQAAEQKAADAEVAANNSLAASNAATVASNNATTVAAGAVSTANQSATDAASAVATANTAVTTANSSITDAANAVSTANTAETTANTAATNAQAALDAVGDALNYDLVDNVASISGSPSDGDAVQVVNSTGIESFTPLSDLPNGFVGDSGINVRIIYRNTLSSWTYIAYAANDPDARYVESGSNVSELVNDANYITAVDIPTIPTAVSELTNDSAYITQSDALPPTGGTINGNLVVDGDLISFGNVSRGSGEIVLNCEANTHGVTIKGPAHSAGATYTITLPDNTGTSGQVLATDGSGNTSWTTVVTDIDLDSLPALP